MKTTTRTTMTFRCACGQNARIVTDAPNQPEWALVGGWTVNTSGGLDTCPDCIARWRAEASTPPVASSPVGGEQHG